MRIKKYYKMVRVDYSDSEYFRITNVDTVSGSIFFENMSGKNIEYSTDGVNWTTLSITSDAAVTIDGVAAGANVYLRGTNNTIGTHLSKKQITADFNHNLGGNICSLLDKTNFSTMTTITSTNAFAHLFYLDTKLVNAVFNFGNVISLGSNVLSETFKYCSSLTTAPDLSNLTSLESYAIDHTFTGCTSLTTIPDLSNLTSLGIYALDSAFEGCSSLYGSLDLRSVTSLGSYALNYAFASCPKLQTIYAPNVNTWDTSKFSLWVQGSGSQATNPQMIFQTQELLDACPSSSSGYGNYTKVLA